MCNLDMGSFKFCVLKLCLPSSRERKKLLQDSLLRLDKVRNIVSKKRQRNEIQSNEKASNSNLLKIGSQVQQNPSDLVGQRLEERTKNGVPNKRVRSSMAEVRVCIHFLFIVLL